MWTQPPGAGGCAKSPAVTCAPRVIFGVFDLALLRSVDAFELVDKKDREGEEGEKKKTENS